MEQVARINALIYEYMHEHPHMNSAMVVMVLNYDFLYCTPQSYSLQNKHNKERERVNAN